MNPDEAIKLLELNLNEEATEESLKKAYRRMALKHHPDRGGNPDDFKKIKDAYETATKYLQQRNKPSQVIPGSFFYSNDFGATTSNFSWTVIFG